MILSTAPFELRDNATCDAELGCKMVNEFRRIIAFDTKMHKYVSISIRWSWLVPELIYEITHG